MPRLIDTLNIDQSFAESYVYRCPLGCPTLISIDPPSIVSPERILVSTVLMRMMTLQDQ